MSPRRRKRNDDIDSLRCILGSYVSVPTKIGAYDTAHLDKNVIIKHKSLLLQLKAHQENLSFSQRQMKQVLMDIATDKKEWRLSDAEMSDFAQKTALRIRGMCRHFSQAIAKKSPPGWIKAVLDGHEQSSLEDACGSVTKSDVFEGTTQIQRTSISQQFAPPESNTNVYALVWTTHPNLLACTNSCK